MTTGCFNELNGMLVVKRMMTTTISNKKYCLQLMPDTKADIFSHINFYINNRSKKLLSFIITFTVPDITFIKGKPFPFLNKGISENPISIT